MGERAPEYGAPVPGDAAGRVAVTRASSVWALTLPVWLNSCAIECAVCVMGYPTAFAGTWSVERGGRRRRCTPGRDGCAVPLRACGGRARLRLRSPATSVDAVPPTSSSGCTAFCRRHSPCFVWVFREGPRGFQAGREMSARVHHSPGLNVMRDARGLVCARANACAWLGCCLRIGRRGGEGRVENRGGARRSSLLAAHARRPLFLPLEQACCRRLRVLLNSRV